MARKTPLGFAPPEERALFVRIPTSEAEKLDRAAFELKIPKQVLVAGLVARYVDPSTAAGLDALRALGAGDWTIGRASFEPASMAEVLTAAQLARMLQVDAATVEKLASRGDLPGRKVGSEWRFSRQAVLAWLARREPSG